MSTVLQINYVRGISLVGILMFFGWIVGFFMGSDFFNWMLICSILSGIIFFVSFSNLDLCKTACLAIGFVLLGRAVSLYFAYDSFIWIGLYFILGILSLGLYFVKGEEYVE